MRERPIMFNGAMVRAIMAGQKTQTRRVMKHQPQSVVVPGVGPMLAVQKAKGTDRWLWPNAREQVIAECPFGQPGDRLWVREAFCDAWDQDRDRWSDPERYYYRADGVEIQDVDGDGPARWTPSIHMPRRACRLVLEITAVRVERLQAISTQDCLAEGITTRFKVADAADELRIQFRDLWNDTGGDWESNPWVWVIEFKAVTP
jgi:hypothetical protein